MTAIQTTPQILHRSAGRAQERFFLPQITVHATYQPTPLAAFDWCAVLDGREEDGCYAYGATPEEATAALIEMFGLDEDAPAAGCIEDATCAACASGHHDTPGEHADCGCACHGTQPADIDYTNELARRPQ